MWNLESQKARSAVKRRIFDAMVTAYGEKRFDEFETFFTPDAVFEWPYPPVPGWPNRMVGVRTFRESSERGMKDFDPYRHKVTEFYDLVDPDLLIAEYQSNTVFHPTGRPYANRYLGIVRFDRDLIMWWKEYINPLTIKEAMGS